METLYIIWAILPGILILLTLRASAKRVLKRPGREYPLDYAKQAAYCVVLLLVAIGIDRWFFDEMISSVYLGDADPRIFRWLLYPVIIGIAAYIQHIFDRKAEKKEQAERHKRQTDYMHRHF